MTAIAFALLPAFAGCVSSLTDDQLALNSSVDETQTASVVVEAAGIETSAGEVSSLTTGASTSAITDEAVAAIAAMEPASVIPEPAPRDSQSSQALSDGATLAFAEAGPTGPTADNVVQPAPSVSRAAATAPAQNTSLFAILFQRRQVREAEEAKTHLASLGPVDQTRNSASGDTPLPGVRPTSELFDAIDGDHDAEAEDDYKVAAVGSLGRLLPTGLRVQTDKVEVGCLKPELVGILKEVERHYGKKPVVTSGYRSPTRNRSAGGARQSLHMQCMAADIQVEGVSKWDLAKYMRTIPGRGGIGTYCRTRSVHIDIGEIRDWHYPCRRLVKLKS